MSLRGFLGLTVMLWNYHDDDVPAPDSPVQLAVTGIPATVKRTLTRHYRIDQSHSNAYAEWKRMGSPQQPTAEQYAALESAGRLQMLESQRWVAVQSGQVRLTFPLPRQAVSLVEISW